MDALSDFISKHGFTALVAVYFLYQNHQDKKYSRSESERMHKEIEGLKGQHFQIQRDIATTLRETNRLVKRIFRIVDDGSEPLPTDDLKKSHEDSNTGTVSPSEATLKAISANEVATEMFSNARR